MYAGSALSETRCLIAYTALPPGAGSYRLLLRHLPVSCEVSRCSLLRSGSVGCACGLDCFVLSVANSVTGLLINLVAVKQCATLVQVLFREVLTLNCFGIRLAAAR